MTDDKRPLQEGEEQDPDNQDQDLYEQYTITADKGQAPLRVDKFLVNRLENTSRNRIQQAARAGSILVNNEPVKQNYKVKPHDVISVVVAEPPQETELKPEKMPLDIYYEDEHLVVLNKPAGMVVHPGVGNWSGTLVNGLLHYFNELPDTSAFNNRPGLVHRLDKDTSGLMVIARDEYSMMHLARQFFNRTTDRRYQALVWGDFDDSEGIVEGNIGRHQRERKKMAVFPEGEEGKHAVTRYKVLRRFGYVSLIECKLETGRTHQIRVHMQHIKHPVFNDDKYGGDHIVKGTVYTKYKQFVENCFAIMPRQALHAKSLGFEHPHTGASMHFDSDLPADFQGVLDKWERYTSNLKIE